MIAGSQGSEGAVADQDDATAGDRLGFRSDRITRAAARDAECAALLARLIASAVELLPRMYQDGAFVFRLGGSRADDRWLLSPAGISSRYAAIAALGLMRLPTSVQRDVLRGETCADLVGRLLDRVDGIASLGDVAMICWAAAEARHSNLGRGLDRLAELSRSSPQRHVVDAAWAVTALLAARNITNVEEGLAQARDVLVGARGPVLYPHMASKGGRWYRSHVGSFADQVYPLQALARLHASADDPQALTIANAIAHSICAAQGRAGQWCWHYDSRTGAPIEEYPVYTVHQHAMAPMALLDLAEAHGYDHMDGVLRGLRWLTAPPEVDEPMVLTEPPVIWRKVARTDRHKVVRGLRAASSRVRPRSRLPLLDQIFPPTAVDHECRPYELGWLLLAWLS